MPLTLTSPAFAEGQTIPVRHTRDGENLSPPLKWTAPPDDTKSFILIVEDPDAPGGIFRHWAIYDIPPDRDGLPQSVDTGPDRAVHFGKNDFGNARYDGLEPPKGHGVHHYHFRQGAVSVPTIQVPAGMGVEEIWRQAEKQLIEAAVLIGTYER